MFSLLSVLFQSNYRDVISSSSILLPSKNVVEFLASKTVAFMLLKNREISLLNVFVQSNYRKNEPPSM